MVSPTVTTAFGSSGPCVSGTPSPWPTLKSLRRRTGAGSPLESKPATSTTRSSGLPSTSSGSMAPAMITEVRDTLQAILPLPGEALQSSTLASVVLSFARGARDRAERAHFSLFAIWIWIRAAAPGPPGRRAWCVVPITLSLMPKLAVRLAENRVCDVRERLGLLHCLRQSRFGWPATSAPGRAGHQAPNRPRYRPGP